MSKGKLQGIPFTVRKIRKNNNDIIIGNQYIIVDQIGPLINKRREFTYNGDLFYYKDGNFYDSHFILLDKDLENEIINYLIKKQSIKSN